MRDLRIGGVEKRASPDPGHVQRRGNLSGLVLIHASLSCPSWLLELTLPVRESQDTSRGGIRQDSIGSPKRCTGHMENIALDCYRGLYIETMV